MYPYPQPHPYPYPYPYQYQHQYQYPYITRTQPHAQISSAHSSPLRTPSPPSPSVRITLPTPPSFLAHRSRSSEGVNMARSLSASALSDSDTAATATANAATATATATTNTRQEKRLSISSPSDPVVQGNEKSDRRVSFSHSTQVISRPTPLAADDASASGHGVGGLKSPVYKIPQRQQRTADTDTDTDAEETLASPQMTNNVSTPVSGRRPLSFQGFSPGETAGAGAGAGGSPSRLASTAAARGISIAPTLREGGGAFRSIWSAGVVPSSKSGWISPSPASALTSASASASANTASKASAKLPTPTSAASTGTGTATSPTVGSAASVAKQRGLSIAILKEDGKGVLPITPGLTSAGAGLKSPLGLGGLKSPEIRVLRGIDSALMNGLPSAKSTGVPDTAGNISSKKEIILCKFYHTPGLTCTSRPCRFVHNLSSVTLAGQGSSTAALTGHGHGSSTLEALLSPRQQPTDPTSGVFAQAQMRAPSTPGKKLRIRGDEVDLDDVQPGERVVVEDESGQEVVGTVFLMSGGGKGAMGKSRGKWKTVPCKDFAEGHCPYGDYCSFIHDEKLPTGLLSDEAKPEPKPDPAPAPAPEPKPTPRLTHRKSASLGSSLSAWTKILPKVQLVPSVTVDPDVLKKAENRLSAFAPPFSKQPVTVDNAGGIVPAPPSPSPVPLLPAALIDMQPRPAEAGPLRSRDQSAIHAPPKLNAWSKGPPPTLKKIASLKKVTITDTEPPSQLATMPAHDMYSHSHSDELKTPTSASHLMPPVSAVSMFGTESDPASPFDPVVQRRKMRELEEALAAAQAASARALPRSNLSHAMSYDIVPPLSSPALAGGYPMSPAMSSDGSDTGLPLSMAYNASTYPWGMPMSPVTAPGYQDPSVPNIPGGLGVMWTPAGWAVQDAAMKLALRSAEVKTKYGEDARRRQAKNYFRTRPCKFFAEGFCPHGDECTYLHVIPPSSPEQTASSDSNSNSDSHSISNGNSNTHGSPVKTKPHPNYKTLPCKFFNSAMGCMNGDSCAFLHTRVVPESVPLVDRPRPWRTKPCRHFQLGRCTLGDACHFAHVLDPAWLASGHGAYGQGHGQGREPACPAWSRTGRCAEGDKCRYLHVGEGGEGNAATLTEEGLERTLEEMRQEADKWNEEDEEDDDDVEIVTGMSSSSYSPSSSSIRT